ncbi:MAG: metal ABC transporter permease [Spirochaetaceae bacterium]|nr:metal ABC transporter permease [Spirochaetaceae bacterium]
MWEALVEPFADFGFMRRALVGCLAISLGATPVGVFLMLRRMSLTGDAMAHAILPGAAVGYLIAGLSLGAMTIGGLIAGMAVALLAGFVTRVTALREDASLAAFYLISLASGVLIVSTRGSNVDLMHVLFGTVLALDNAALILLGAIASLSLFTLAVLFRPLVLESADPQFLRSVSGLSAMAHLTLLILVVLNLVGGFQALGTLMAVGIMILPAAAARFWTVSIGALIAVATAIAMLSSVSGLLLSYHFSLPSGPAIILVAGLAYTLSLIVGPVSGLAARALWDRVPVPLPERGGSLGSRE